MICYVSMKIKNDRKKLSYEPLVVIGYVFIYILYR